MYGYVHIYYRIGSSTEKIKLEGVYISCRYENGVCLFSSLLYWGSEGCVCYVY